MARTLCRSNLIAARLQNRDRRFESARRLLKFNSKLTPRGGYVDVSLSAGAFTNQMAIQHSPDVGIGDVAFAARGARPSHRQGIRERGGGTERSGGQFATGLLALLVRQGGCLVW
jgi:hypothetical protein